MFLIRALADSNEISLKGTGDEPSHVFNFGHMAGIFGRKKYERRFITDACKLNFLNPNPFTF